MRIYIAAPFSKGDQILNIRAAFDAAEELAIRGHMPFVPHVTGLWHLVHPKPYDWWLRYDNVWLLQCDALLRLPGESPGADEEVALAARRGIPVYHSLHRVPPGDPDDIAAYRHMMRAAQSEEARAIAAMLDSAPKEAAQ